MEIVPVGDELAPCLSVGAKKIVVGFVVSFSSSSPFPSLSSSSPSCNCWARLSFASDSARSCPTSSSTSAASSISSSGSSLASSAVASLVFSSGVVSGEWGSPSSSWDMLKDANGVVASCNTDRGTRSRRDAK